MTGVLDINTPYPIAGNLEMTIEESLERHLAKIGTAPFLFVGSGLSRRHINLETWGELLRRFAAALPQPFEYYHGLATRDLPKTAELIAEAFYEHWWVAPEYESSRVDFREQMHDKASSLKYEISKYMLAQKYTPGQSPKIDEEIELLKKATIDGVITTNWDKSLENIFPDFEVFIGQNQILFSVSQGIAEIYKIHGCCTVPNSLVLTASDYQNFNDRNPYLAAKLLTIFVEHPVIFLGYSLSDENITSILRQVASCLTNENIHKLKDRLIFVQRDGDNRGDSFEASVMQIGGHALPLTIIRTNDWKQVYSPLGKIKRRFSARLLRKMKEHIYEIVKSNDPQSKLAVADIDDEKFNELEIVFGVGVTKGIGRLGYAPISRLDILKDVMTPSSTYDPELIVTEALPKVLQNTPFVPIFRYLRAANRISADGKIDCSNCHERVRRTANFQQANFYPPRAYQRELDRVQRDLKTIENVIRYFGENACMYISLLRPEQVDAEALRKFIIGNMDKLSDKKVQNQTYFPRLICFYDWVVNR